jgi:hypothetical protein
MIRACNAGNQAVRFDITRCVLLDAEVYPGRAVVGLAYSRGGDLVVKHVEDRRELAALLRRLRRQGRTVVGYNSARYDLGILRAILAGADVYGVSRAIIAGDRPAAGEMLRRAPRVRVDHVDISERLRRGKYPPSLKLLAAAMGRRTLEELPFDPDRPLSDEQWDRVKVYNAGDLGHTGWLLERVAPDLESLAALSAIAGRDLRSVPAPAVVEAIFRADYLARHGEEPPAPGVPDRVTYTPPPGVVRPRTPEAGSWFDGIVGAPIPPRMVGDVPRFRVERARFRVGPLEMSAGSGGLHSLDAPMVYYADEAHEIIAVDVASFYPHIMANMGIVPGAYGETGRALYRGILEERLRLKAAARDAADPDQKRKLEVRANGLKLVLNSTFGQFGNPYSTLYDPAALIGVTVTGQLLLLDLVERLQAVGIEVLSANTDGLFVRRPSDNFDFEATTWYWEQDTGMKLELEYLARLAIASTNHYASLDLHGKVKRRGDAFKAEFATCSSPSTFALPNSLIVGAAVTDALLKDIPPERTVGGCRDLLMFTRIARRTRAVAEAVLRDDETGAEAPLPKVVRYYLAKASRKRIVHRLAGGKQTTPREARGIELAMDIPPGPPPEDLDRSRYIRAARKLIQSVGGYRHRDAGLLGEHALARAVFDAGLLPVPKWDGKAQMPGSDARRPTLLWDWSRVVTVGTYTGPAVGILAVDIDDASLWSKGVSKGNLPLLGDRFASLEGCLVSSHGAATAEDVRMGRARGKLIFRAVGLGPDHRIARMGVSRWHKRHGVDVFYGRGMPSVLGRYSDDDVYRLEGTLSDAPEWLIEMLTPAPSKARRKTPAVAPADGPGDLETLRAELAAMEPKLDPSAWLEKEHDDRTILVAPCPFEHASGRNGDADLSAGFHDGEPYVHCLHGSCDGSRDLNDRLAGVAGGDGAADSATSAASDGAADPPPEAVAKGKAGKAGSDAREQESQADRLIRLAAAVTWFHDAAGRAYGATAVDGHVEVYPVDSTAMRRWLRHIYYQNCGRTPTADALREAIGHFDAFATYHGREEETYVRVAARDGAIFVDLGDPRRQVVQIDADGWRLTTDCPVRFVRPESLRALPEPTRDGRGLEALRRLANLDRDDFLLAVSWLVAALVPGIAYPVVVLIGESGSAKTSMGRLLKNLVDPTGAPLRSQPRDEQDLLIAALNCQILAFDNITSIKTWLSDAFCRLSTGGGLSKRKLFTDAEEVVIEVRRPLLLTGITDIITQADLLDRVLTLHLRVIPRKKRLTDKRYKADIDRAHPTILGAIFDTLAGALRNLLNVEGENRPLPRMADFSLMGEAVARAIGRKAGAFLRVYDANRRDASETLIEGNLVADAVRQLADRCQSSNPPGWEGTASQLLVSLTATLGDRAKSKYWPKDATRLAGTLRKLAASLRMTGVSVRFRRDMKSRERTRLIAISRVTPKRSETASAASAASADIDHRGDQPF